MDAKAIGLLLIVALVSVAACTTSPHAQIMEATTGADGRTLELVVGTCNADLTTKTEESPTQVTVTVTARNDTSDDCLDGVVVHLDRPLGDRRLVDGATGETVRIQP
jgi:hypothetical protein